mmetsp:Transcript_71829/g.163038  ORF Transcript_71829/g.163038 Transcript_71829/m.163038 type:complete len:202 (-) Transcript_71829:465-1070(-)
MTTATCSSGTIMQRVTLTYAREASISSFSRHLSVLPALGAASRLSAEGANASGSLTGTSSGGSAPRRHLSPGMPSLSSVSQRAALRWGSSRTRPRIAAAGIGMRFGIFTFSWFTRVPSLVICCTSSGYLFSKSLTCPTMSPRLRACASPTAQVMGTATSMDCRSPLTSLQGSKSRSQARAYPRAKKPTLPYTTDVRTSGSR